MVSYEKVGLFHGIPISRIATFKIPEVQDKGRLKPSYKDDRTLIKFSSYVFVGIS